MLIVSPAVAAPAPDERREEQGKLDALGNELPGLVASGATERFGLNPNPPFAFHAQVKYLRRVAEHRAKATVVLDYSEPGKPPQSSMILSVRLQYFEGAWSTIDYDGTWNAFGAHQRETGLYLLLAIDRAGAK
jgi:hypothetical protein